MNRQNFYFGKLVDVNEMDEFQNNIENSINLLKIIIGKGIMKGGNFSINNLSLTIDDTIAFDKDGNNILIDSQVLDFSSFVPAQDKIVVSITANFTREYSQSEMDDQGNPVFFKEDESSHINYIEGDVSANPIPPDILDSQVLIADITLSQGQTEIIQDNISYSRAKRFSNEGKKVIDIFNHLLENYYKKDETLFKSNNLSDVPNKANARANLGLTAPATHNYGNSVNSICQGNDSRLSDSRKCNNTFDDVSTARNNLSVYSKDEIDSLANQTDKIIPITGTEATKYILLFRRRNSQGGVCVGRFVGHQRLLTTGANATTIIDIAVKSDSNTPSIAVGSYTQNYGYNTKTEGFVLGLFYVTYNSKEYIALKINDTSGANSIYDGYFGFIGRWYDLEDDGLFVVNSSTVTEGNAIIREGITHSNSPSQLPQIKLTQSNEYTEVWHTDYQVLQTFDKFRAIVYNVSGATIWECNNMYRASDGWRMIDNTRVGYVVQYWTTSTTRFFIPAGTGLVTNLNLYALFVEKNNEISNMPSIYPSQFPSHNVILPPFSAGASCGLTELHNIIKYGDKTGVVSLFQIFKKNGENWELYEGSDNYACLNNSVTYIAPVVSTDQIRIEITLSSADHVGKAVGVATDIRNGRQAKSCLIELYFTGGGTYPAGYYKVFEQINGQGTGVYQAIPGNNNNGDSSWGYGWQPYGYAYWSTGVIGLVSKIRITLSDLEASLGYLNIQNVWFYSLNGYNKSYIPTVGGVLYDNLNANGNRITGHPEPISDNDLAIKGYVDTFAGKGRVWEFNIADTGTFIAPYTGLYELFMIGAGGGGFAGAAADYAAGGRAGGGGGGAGRTIRAIVRLKQGVSYSYTVGLGGIGGIKNTTPGSGFNNTPPTSGGYTRFQFFKGDTNGYIYANGGNAGNNQNGGAVGSLPSERCIIQDLGGDNGSNGGSASGTSPYIGGSGGAGGRSAIFYKTIPGGAGASTSGDTNAGNGASAYEHGSGGAGGGGGASDGQAPYLLAGDGGSGYDGFLSIKFLGEDGCGN